MATWLLNTGSEFDFSFNLLKRLTLSLFFAMIMLAAVSSPAGTGGSVSGTVKDATGAVVPNAAVSANNLDTGVQVRAQPMAVGFIHFPNCPSDVTPSRSRRQASGPTSRLRSQSTQTLH